MSVLWHEHANPEKTAEAAARFVLGRLEDALAGQPFATIALSGGTAPRHLFVRLAAAPFNWERVHFFCVDERCVPPSHAESNFRLVNETLFSPARIPKSQIHRILGELRPDVAAQRYVQEIRETLGLEEGAQPRFDVLHLGLGSDGHTASLFPGEPLLDDRSGIAAAVHVEKLNSWRVTLLPGALLAARQTFFLATGEAKREAVGAVLAATYDPRRWPAQLITHHGRRVVCFVDYAAAGKESAASS